MPKATIRNSIRQLRFAHGEMTQQALADQAGCTRQTIMMLEQERYVPSLVLAMRIAKLFNEPVERVFTLEEPC
jgi:putative transcriptional regulator